MTRLGKFVRRMERKQFSKTKSRGKNWKSDLWKRRRQQRQRILWYKQSAIENLANSSEKPEPLEIGNGTMREMKVVVSELVHPGYSDYPNPVSVSSLCSALVGDNRVMDAHGGANPIFNEFLKRSDEQETEGLEVTNKYSLMGALNFLEKRNDSITKKVSSWEEAKEALKVVIKFPEMDEEPSLQPEVDTAKRYLSQSRQLFGTLDVLSQPFYEKWNQVMSFLRPEKLGGEQGAGAHRTGIEFADARFASRVDDATKKFEATLKSAAVAHVAARLEEKERKEEANKRASLLMRDMDDNERDMVNTAMYGLGPPDEKLAQAGSDFVQRSSMQTLQPGQWLNDEVIHYFYLMLSKRDEEMCQNDPSRSRSHFFKSFFITKLRNEGHRDPDIEGTYEYRNVKRWSKKVPGKDLFNLDKVFFPINQGQMHWMCAVAFIKEKRIQIYDSMGSHGSEYLEDIFQYLQDDHRDKKKSELPDPDSWDLVPCQDDIPRQRNGYDCGVFTCMFADFLSKDCPLVFSQDHITQCRERIALSIMNGKAIM